MVQRCWLHPSIGVLLLLLSVADVTATILPMRIPVSSGTLTISGPPKYFMHWPLGYLPAFNLITETGGVTGTAPVSTPLMYVYGLETSSIVDPSLQFIPPVNGMICCTGLTITTPDVVRIGNDGACCGAVDAWLRAPSITVTPGGQSTFVVPFLFSMTVNDSGVPDITVWGGGNATLQFDTTGNQVSLVGATYSFDPVPEPSTGIFCVIASLGAVAVAMARSLRNRRTVTRRSV